MQPLVSHSAQTGSDGVLPAQLLRHTRVQCGDLQDLGTATPEAISAPSRR